MKRKTPIKHVVHEHYRNGRLIEEYDRGTGRSVSSKKRRMPPAPRVAKVKGKAYTVNFKYSKKRGDGESFLIIARDYPNALEEAFEEQTDARKPTEISIIDPTMGEIVHLIGKGAKRAAKAGARYAIKSGKEGIKRGGRFAFARVKDEYAKRLIKNAYSDDIPTRTIARSRLKKEFPDIYNIMDFSTRRKKKKKTKRKMRKGRETSPFWV